MLSHIDLKGASGAVYRFRPADDPRAKTPMSGNFVYLRVSDDSYTVVYAADADNLMTDTKARWSQAVADYGATDIFIRLNISQATRRDELSDLLRALSPIMNEDQEPSRIGGG